jgi:hypothetical protein
MSKLLRLCSLAGKLDRAGFHREASAIDESLYRFAQNLNPHNLNIPIQQRVYPMDSDMLEYTEEKRKKENPRLLPKQPLVLPGDTDTEEETRYSPFDMNTEGEPTSGIMMMFPDTQSPSMAGDVKAGEWSKRPAFSPIPRWGWD